MKIALVSPYDFAYPGGVVSHISCLEKQLTRLGHEVKIIAPASKAVYTFGERFIRVGTPRPIPVSGSIARITLSLRLESQIEEIFAREKFDICHLHEPLVPTLCTTVLRLKPVPMVGTFHASGGRPWYTMFSPVVKNHLDRWFRKLDRRIAVSPVAMQYINTYFPAEYTIIPNGIDLSHFVTRAQALPQFMDGKINILFVGRMEKRKGFDYLWKAFRLVKQEVPNSRLIAVGPGVRLRRKYERRIARCGLEDVIFTGYVDYDDLPRYYHTADIVCFPNIGWESFGVVLLEAMSVGKPIVASAIDGFRSVLSDGVEGITVPPRNVEKLAGAILELIRDEGLRHRMGQAGRLKVQQYDWALLARRILDVYRDVLEKYSPPKTEVVVTSPST
ncbi:MAG: glycosyltransferase family 4 protein [Dehalococcoidales bacterium]|nr:glycosyltransferase family 4 protein [Dehalococcoidales bacterium]